MYTILEMKTIDKIGIVLLILGFVISFLGYGTIIIGLPVYIVGIITLLFGALKIKIKFGLSESSF